MFCVKREFGLFRVRSRLPATRSRRTRSPFCRFPARPPLSRFACRSQRRRENDITLPKEMELFVLSHTLEKSAGMARSRCPRRRHPPAVRGLLDLAAGFQYPVPLLNFPAPPIQLDDLSGIAGGVDRQCRRQMPRHRVAAIGGRRRVKFKKVPPPFAVGRGDNSRPAQPRGKRRTVLDKWQGLPL